MLRTGGTHVFGAECVGREQPSGAAACIVHITLSRSPPKQLNFLFKLKARNTTFTTELRAGTTTFLTLGKPQW